MLRDRVLALTEGATPELVRNTDVLAIIDELLGKRGGEAESEE